MFGISLAPMLEMELEVTLASQIECQFLLVKRPVETTVIVVVHTHCVIVVSHGSDIDFGIVIRGSMCPLRPKRTARESVEKDGRFRLSRLSQDGQYQHRGF